MLLMKNKQIEPRILFDYGDDAIYMMRGSLLCCHNLGAIF